MITEEKLKRLLFYKKEDNREWYYFDSKYLYIELSLESKAPYCFLYSNDSSDREAVPFRDLNIEKLNCILEFIKAYESNSI